MSTIYEADNHLLICTKNTDPELHSHSAAHIIISLDDDIEIITTNERIKCKGILIPSRTFHTANTNKNKVLIFMFDNTTNVSNRIKSLELLSDEIVDQIVKSYYFFNKNDKSELGYRLFINQITKSINIEVPQNRVRNQRILDALKYIQSNLDEQLNCKDVANFICLSEGRFSHLFKEQMGMTFSAYIIYQRIIKTYTGIINGKSITEASIDAGFSSSSHFASTNKKIFGLSAKTIRKDLDFQKIALI